MKEKVNKSVSHKNLLLAKDSLIIVIENKQYPYTFELYNIYDNIIEFKLISLKDNKQNIYLTLNSYNNKKVSIFLDTGNSINNNNNINTSFSSTAGCPRFACF